SPERVGRRKEFKRKLFGFTVLFFIYVAGIQSICAKSEQGCYRVNYRDFGSLALGYRLRGFDIRGELVSFFGCLR
ncbi:MAG: hypothetical protein ACXW32_11970, partial [Limisphaerales bacterium]